MPERPNLVEIGGTLLACAVALLVLAQIDDAGVRRHEARAATAAAVTATRAVEPGSQNVVADTPAVMPSRAPVTVAPGDVPGRAMALGWLGLVAAGGLGMCALGVRVLRRRWA